MAAAEVQGREAVPILAPDELPEGTMPGTWGWQMPPSRGDINAATARAAREQRIANRLDHLPLWRAGLARLAHYDPDYEYDVVHEYEHEWTTDPDYGCDGIHLLDYDEDGFVSPEVSRHLLLIAAIVHTLCDALGNRAVHEMEVHYSPKLGEDLGLLTGEGKGKSFVKPDLTVLPPEHALPPDRERGKWGRALNLELGDPIPELVVEIVSPTSERRDFADKMRLYAALGIAEYLVIEPGEPPDSVHDEPGHPSDLWLFTPGPDGAYRQTGDSSKPFSVCGIPVRLWRREANQMPVFQWKDEEQGLWRDAASDRERLGERRGEQRGIRLGEVATALKFLDAALPDLPRQDRDRIEALWQQAGVPEDVAERLLAGPRIPGEWHFLLPDNAELDNNDTSAPHSETRPPSSGAL